MVDFHIDGDSGAIRARTAEMRTKGEAFVTTGDSLSRITTDGWTGRAAEKFADKFDAEPERWRKAGDGFTKAAASLEAYADALDEAKRRAAWAKEEHARGDRETESARSAYDADVARGRQEVADAAAQGTHMTLTILPFEDPGEAIRKGALDELSSAKADLEKAGHVAADGVRAGAVDAPAKRKWYEKVGAAVGGFLVGAGEAVVDLLTMFPTSPINMLIDSYNLATGDMTPEELAAKYRMSVESVGDMLQALQDDPLEFGKQLGKGLLDWDTWADDPARALGHLVPDIVATIATGGAGASLKGLRGLQGLHDVSLMSRPLHGLQSLRGMNLNDLAGLSKMDDLQLSRHLDGLTPDQQAALLRRGEAPGTQSFEDVFGPHRYDTDYSRVANTFDGTPGPINAHPPDGPLVNLHGTDSPGSGAFWTDPAEMLGARTEPGALDRMGLRDEWYMKPDGDGGYTYSPRDEITVRDFDSSDSMRMQEGPLAPQDRADAVTAWDEPTNGPAPDVGPFGNDLDATRPGGAQQYVMGLDEPAYGAPGSSWTGPAPWVEAVPDGAWEGFFGGAGAGAGGSLLLGGDYDDLVPQEVP